MPELASERFVVHAGERNSSSAPKVQEKPLTLSSFSQEPPMLFLLFARVPVPVPFIKTAPREGGKGLWNIFQYCTGAMSRGRLIGLITAVFTPFGLYTIIME